MAIYLIGFVLILSGLINLFKVFSRRSWPETIGKIQKNEETEVARHSNYWFNSGLFSKHTARPIEDSGKSKELWLSYVFVVDGYKYVGNQLYSAPIWKPKNRIFDLAVGDKVKVFYKPGNPHSAFLAHSFSWPSMVICFLGLVVLGLAYYLSTNA